MYFTIVLLIISITSISSAPTSNYTIKSLLENDSRVEKLRTIPFIRGFCLRGNLDEFSESLCLSLYDVGLAFNKSQIKLIVGKKNYKSEDFCANLEQVIPTEPLNKETTVYNGAPWLKDIFKNKEGQKQCGDKCFFSDIYDDYSYKPSPICRFLFEQFSTIQQMRLNVNSEKANQNVNKQEEAKDNEVLAKTSPDASIPATNSQIKSNKQTTVEVEEAVSAAVIPLIPANSSKSDPAVVAVNQNSLESTNTNQTKLKTSVDITTDTKTLKDEKHKDDEVKKIDLLSPGKDDEMLKKPQENIDPNLNNDDGTNVFDETDDASPVEGLQDDKESEYNEDEDGLTNDNNRNVALKQPQANNDEEAEPANEKDGPKVVNVSFQEDPDSNFFIYLCGVMFLCVFLYVLQQNRKKLLALCLEGRRGSRRNRERSRGGSKAVYSKLDCNLEEAIMSKKSLNGKSMDIIY